MIAINRSYTLDDIEDVTNEILETCKLSKVFLCKGNLGAGKTTLIKSLCKTLGVQNEVSSPTYSIINEYKSNHGFIYHMDLYRLQSEDQALDLDLLSYLDSNNYCFIEWPDIIINYLHDPYYLMSIESIDAHQRNVICQLTNNQNIT